MSGRGGGDRCTYRWEADAPQVYLQVRDISPTGAPTGVAICCDPRNNALCLQPHAALHGQTPSGRRRGRALIPSLRGASPRDRHAELSDGSLSEAARAGDRRGSYEAQGRHGGPAARLFGEAVPCGARPCDGRGDFARSEVRHHGEGTEEGAHGDGEGDPPGQVVSTGAGTGVGVAARTCRCTCGLLHLARPPRQAVTFTRSCRPLRCLRRRRAPRLARPARARSFLSRRARPRSRR